MAMIQPLLTSSKWNMREIVRFLASKIMVKSGNNFEIPSFHMEGFPKKNLWCM